ncbi:hypothetical protein HNQ60_005158 [Povalibacter uvarum]|uniref:Uncharacterized protein n=1 Tax=Povalibacter uvarum TaxID=732238 RepID=A0A841HTL2_9GAMM|nr:hypothetical protein [Povalibacter uvarum]MBB6096236.1 hypothetical protein [Povalibacter uvarum]
MTYGSGVTTHLLANDRVSQSESYVMRPLGPYEFLHPLAFDLSRDGKREPLAAGEQLSFTAVARRSKWILLGIRPPSSAMPDFYRASLDAPGSSVKFAAGTFVPSGNWSKPKINEAGTLIAYGRGDTPGANPAVPRLRLMSTQTTDHDWPISRPDGTRGTGQFEFLPAR